MRTLEGKTVWVTGAAGGIGAPLVRLLAAREADVTAIDRLQTDAPNFVVDLADEDALGGLCGMLRTLPPDVFVNLAGVMVFGPLAAADPAQIAACYRLNLVVPALLAQAAAQGMQRRGSGRIVNVGSMLGAIPYPWFAAYSSGKAGLAALSQALRRELAGTGVEVTHVAPRAAKTPFNTGPVERFLAATGMSADAPEAVARRITTAICRGERDVGIGAMERVYAVLNALAPGLIDRGLAGQMAAARLAFPEFDTRREDTP